MDLSEAIRLGAMLKPQGFGGLHTRRKKGLFGLFGEPVDATCALGAAFGASPVFWLNAVNLAWISFLSRR